jgi:hypothetical protein
MFTILTLYKNYKPHFFTFRKFYKNLWDIHNFVYFVGYTSVEDYNYIIKENISILGNYNKYKILDEYNYDFINNIELFILDNNIFILYKTNFSKNSKNEWGLVKKILHTYYFNNFHKKNNLYLNIEDDEFYYSTNIDKLKKNLAENNFYRFHFVELIPDNNYLNLCWCYQSWWSHKLDKNVNSYCCNTCKTLYCNINNIPDYVCLELGPWIHSNSYNFKNSTCEYFLNNINTTENINYKLLEKGICFHWTAFTLKNLIETKHKNRHLIDKDNLKNDNYGNYINNIDSVKNIYKTFIDNTLLKYIDYKDIDLLRE